MNPVIYKLGSIEIHAFAAWIAAGVVMGSGIILGAAFRQPSERQRLMRWLDVIVGATVGGVIGARAFHVWLNWAYFSVHTDQITAVTSGGLDWHGAVVGGLLGAILIAVFRRVPLALLLDAISLVLPFGAITVWLACAAANAGYGMEVQTLADFPAWLVTESPDVYGIVAPRLNLLPAGIILAIGVLVIVLILTTIRWLEGLRLWLALVLYSMGMAVIDVFRAEYVPMWFGRRADEILDLALVLAALLMLVIGMVYKIMAARRHPLITRSVTL